jgi:hypothetical protein
VGWLKHFHITLTFIYRRLSKDIKLIPMRRKIIRKKKENEAGETLSKIKGGKELEIAAIILNELAQRKKRKNEIDNKQNNLKEIKEKEKKTERPIDKDTNMKNWALAFLPAYIISITLLVEPIGSGLLAWLIFNEIPSLGVLIGGIIVLCGVYVVALSEPVSNR